MRVYFLIAAGALVCLALSCGCRGPEEKLGRGIRNATEFARLGELRRTVEQSALFESPEYAYTTGVIRGFNRSVIRTLVGIYEIATFPLPTYEPILRPGCKILPDASVDPVYPDSYKPQLIELPTFETDTALGFSGGDIAPFIPGSRFRVFDY